MAGRSRPAWTWAEPWTLMPDESAGPRPSADDELDGMVFRTTPPVSDEPRPAAPWAEDATPLRVQAEQERIERSLDAFEFDPRVRPLRRLTVLLDMAELAHAEGDAELRSDLLTRFGRHAAAAISEGVVPAGDAATVLRGDESSYELLVTLRSIVRRIPPLYPVCARVEEVRPHRWGSVPSDTFATMVVAVDRRRHECLLANSVRSGAMPSEGDVVVVTFAEKFGRIQEIVRLAGDAKPTCWGTRPHPTVEQMRTRFAEWGVPFFEEARGAHVVEVEESGDHTLHRYFALLSAGIVWPESASVPVRSYPGPDQARRRRICEPAPDVMIVCRTQIEAGRAIRETERTLGLPRVPIITSGGRPVAELVGYAREMDADAVVRVPVEPAALAEVVMRVGWPRAFARACRAMGLDPTSRPWPTGTAPVPGAGLGRRAN